MDKYVFLQAFELAGAITIELIECSSFPWSASQLNWFDDLGSFSLIWKNGIEREREEENEKQSISESNWESYQEKTRQQRGDWHRGVRNRLPGGDVSSPRQAGGQLLFRPTFSESESKDRGFHVIRKHRSTDILGFKIIKGSVRYPILSEYLPSVWRMAGLSEKKWSYLNIDFFGMKGKRFFSSSLRGCFLCELREFFFCKTFHRFQLWKQCKEK